jgi:hypothetical protein
LPRANIAAPNTVATQITEITEQVMYLEMLGPCYVSALDDFSLVFEQVLFNFRYSTPPEE